MSLHIYSETLHLVRDLRALLGVLAKHDADLAKQMRRALTSIPLNIAEGEGRRNGNARMRFQTAMGSANEVRACIEVAEALGCIAPQPQYVDALDRIARTLNRLS